MLVANGTSGLPGSARAEYQRNLVPIVFRSNGTPETSRADLSEAEVYRVPLKFRKTEHGGLSCLTLVIRVDTSPDQNNTFSEQVQAGVRVDHWFEFPAPLNGAKVFNVVLVSNNSFLGGYLGDVEFPKFEVVLE